MQSQPGNALTDFNKCLSLKPENPECYLRRAQALYNLGRYNEAYSDVQTARNAGVKVENAYFDQLKKAAGK